MSFSIKCCILDVNMSDKNIMLHFKYMNEMLFSADIYPWKLYLFRKTFFLVSFSSIIQFEIHLIKTNALYIDYYFYDSKTVYY